MTRCGPSGGRPRGDIRVVADTNVYVSAIVFGGACEAILALTRAGVVELFLSPAIQRELKAVLTDTFGWTQSQVRGALAEVRTLASLVRPSVRLSGILGHAEGPVVTTRNGRLIAVLLAPRDGEDLKRLVLAHSPRFQTLLDESRASIGAGKGLSRTAFWKAVAERQRK